MNGTNGTYYYFDANNTKHEMSAKQAELLIAQLKSREKRIKLAREEARVMKLKEAADMIRGQ